jgi:hypothetical protein
MFSFFKRKSPTESTPVASSMSPWELSEDEQLLDQIGEYTYAKLKRMKVNLNRRKFKDKEGRALSIGQVAQRLHKAKPHMPLHHIEDSVMSWLEEAYEPEGITDGDMEEEAQLKIEAWLEAHDQARQTSEIS